MVQIEVLICRAAEREEQRGQFALGPQGLGGLFKYYQNLYS